jgi:hypothetical protein
MLYTAHCRQPPASASPWAHEAGEFNFGAVQPGGAASGTTHCPVRVEDGDYLICIGRMRAVRQ